MQDTTQRWRRLWFKLHLYPALVFGLLLAFIGAAGSLSVYQEGLDALLNPSLVVDAPSVAPLPLDRILTAVRAAHPDRRGAWTLELPRSPTGMVIAWYEQPSETLGAIYAPLMVAVNPYTAEVVASRFWGQTTATWLWELHTQLHLGRFGWKLVGVLGVVLMLSVGSGVYLWWPGWARWRRMFSLDHKHGWDRFALDVHRLVGISSAVILLLLAVTGITLAYPNLAESLTGTSDMGHGDEGPIVLGSAMPNDRPVGVDEAIVLARGPFPHAEVRRVTAPVGPLDTYRITLRQRSEVNQRHPVTTVWVDRYSGQIRQVRNPARFSSGERLMSWLWPLHTGEAFGAGGRFLWFLAGWIPGILYCTGMLRWLIGKGAVRDRAVDFRPVRRSLTDGRLIVGRVGRLLLRVVRRWGSWAWAVLMRQVKALKRRYGAPSRKPPMGW